MDKNLKTVLFVVGAIVIYGLYRKYAPKEELKKGKL